MQNVQTLKGFRDFLPKEARKRQYVIFTLKKVFESYGFEPLETPALEYEEVLMGKYGEEGDKLMYRFVDNGDRRVALRYDQTVPLSRVVAQYQNELPNPFKRYQIQPVWRAENTQKGRFREFLQCDIDIAGTTSPIADAEVISVVVAGLSALGFKNYKVIINDRSVFSELSKEAIIAIDKLDKIGRDGVLKELTDRGIADPERTLSSIENAQPTENLQEIMADLEKLGVSSDKYKFDPTLARGLDYYTGLILEVKSEDYPTGSLVGGGRYDKLIGMFAGRDIPAVGCAFGFDRVMDAMEELKLFPEELSATQVLVSIFSPELLDKSIEVSAKLHSSNIATELWLDPASKLEKQLKYADQKQIPFVAIIGPDEAKENKVTVKDLKNKSQETLTLDELIQKLSS